ncbi:Macrolide export ATP-binding/permease protein MacB [Thalassocella blandensis]|nr:Macrolide export ATP-binding/permease protein MacB [Thalassocella blandensis]
MFDLDRWREILFTFQQHKMRTLLTAFGVFWGIFMLVMLLGVGKSLQQGSVKNFGGHTNTIWMWSGSATQIPYKGLPTGRRVTLKDGDLAALRKLPELGLSSSVNNLGGWMVNQYIVRKSKSGTFPTSGVEPEIFTLSGYTMLQGRAINDLDFKEKRKIAVIGPTVADILFEPGESPIGEELEIGGVNFTVIGVFLGREDDQEDQEKILLPNSTLRTTFNQTGWIGHFQLAPKPGINAAVLEQKAKAVIMSRHHIHPSDMNVVGTYNAQKDFDKVNGLFTGIKVFSWVVAIGTIIAGVVGVGNIMLIIVKERTREIGLHKALGATPSHIIGTILMETLIITLISGYLGLAVGVFCLEGLTSFLGQQHDVDMFANAEIDFTTALLALAALVVAGCFAAILPASKAASVDPIVALQDE